MSYPPQQPYVPQPPKKTNTLALVGFILSVVFALLSLMCLPFFGPISLGLSIAGLIQVNKNPNQGGKGLAIAGIAISSLSIVWLFATLLIAGIGLGGLSTMDY